MDEASATSRLARWVLPLAAVAAALAVLAGLAAYTRSRIEHNERAWFEAQLNTLIPTGMRDNDLLRDRIVLRVPMDTNTITAYRARRAGEPVAVALHTTTQGYGGPIELLVAVDYSGQLLGVHILSHQETPGIGNAFELPGSTWLRSFIGRSLDNTQGWALRKDGGDFDAFTSASITPRAIVKAVQGTLQLYQSNRDRIFAP